MFICIPSYAQCRVGPDAGHCPMSGGAYDMFIYFYVIMCMVSGSLARLTKLHTYNFQCWFQVILVAKGRARDDYIAHTMMF